MASPPPVIIVRGNELRFMGRSYRCAVGKNGFSSDKHEGDGTTPLGVFHLRECLYRADRLENLRTDLPMVALCQDDGWCDDPESPAYNRPIKRPYDYSHELMWREDRLYDVVVPLGYNDDPAEAGKGSAIFLHMATPDYAPTEGCVALSSVDLLLILPHLSVESFIEIHEN